jgi:hypothetical protein
LRGVSLWSGCRWNREAVPRFRNAHHSRSNVSKIDAPEYEGWSGRPNGGSILFRFDPCAGVTLHQVAVQTFFNLTVKWIEGWRGRPNRERSI